MYTMTGTAWPFCLSCVVFTCLLLLTLHGSFVMVMTECLVVVCDGVSTRCFSKSELHAVCLPVGHCLT